MDCAMLRFPANFTFYLKWKRLVDKKSSHENKNVYLYSSAPEYGLYKVKMLNVHVTVFYSRCALVEVGGRKNWELCRPHLVGSVTPFGCAQALNVSHCRARCHPRHI